MGRWERRAGEREGGNVVGRTEEMGGMEEYTQEQFINVTSCNSTQLHASIIILLHTQGWTKK